MKDQNNNQTHNQNQNTNLNQNPNLVSHPDFDPAIKATPQEWAEAERHRKLEEFQLRAHDNLARDHSGALVYLAPSRVNLQLTLERFPDIRFSETREHLANAGA